MNKTFLPPVEKTITVPLELSDACLSSLTEVLCVLSALSAALVLVRLSQRPVFANSP